MSIKMRILLCSIWIGFIFPILVFAIHRSLTKVNWPDMQSIYLNTVFISFSVFSILYFLLDCLNSIVNNKDKG